MARLSESTKAQVKLAARHPIRWWRGNNLPQEEIRPWEYGIQLVANLFPGFMDGFLSLKDRLYVGKAQGKVRSTHKGISEVITTLWDGINDPLIGMYMDRKRFGVNVHRTIMRVAAIVCPLLALFQCFNLGLSPMQRLFSWIILGIISDTISTANDVSASKIWAGITPHSNQRGRLQMFRQFGSTIATLVSGLPWQIIGFAPNFGIELTEYQVMIWGAAIFAPLALFSKYLPSMAKQRIDFTTQIVAQEDIESNEIADLAQAERKMTLRESFTVVKYNSWFMLWLVIDFIRVLVPGTDRMFIYQFLIPQKTLFGKVFTGIALKTILDIVMEWPCFVLTPLGPRAVEKLGGPVPFVKVHMGVNLVTQILSFAVGYKTWPRLIFMRLMETMRDTMGNWSPVAHNVIQYQMFDYVEYKTGYRSEGITQSIDGILKKLIKNNVGTFLGRAVEDWTGYQGWDIPIEKQPDRFMKSIWPLLHIGPIFGELVALIAIARYKLPYNADQLEADLIERRALAQKLKDNSSEE